MRQRGKPAVVAGLVGMAPFLVPDVAQALSLSEMIDTTFATPTEALVAGAVGGAVLTGAVATAAVLVARARSESADEAPSHARHLRVDDASPSQVRPAPQDEPAHPGHAATSYEEIAQNYVGRATFRERMARRAEGVAATLRERMGANMMDGLPIIERADGSVGDVGTSWWRDAVGEQAIAHDAGFAAEEASAIPSDFSATDRDRLGASAARRAGSIASRVAVIDEGAYPERRTLEDLDGADEWERALRSLDEKIASVVPSQDPVGFIDSVGGVDSLDEPDNMEPNTAFIPFRAPGGHPEVVDTETYVDYLIEDEFSKNSSTAARRSSRRFLRLLEGGTQPTSRHLANASSSRPAYAGKHFAVPRAAEA